ncbi:MAG: hypothetical protein C0421_03970 [Hyphomonas sp.]|uniref:DUF3137 domain-containing protein n=1 Tax=Hyphomonas sp. TaxID=87 RepID=UPI0025B964EA|nr:DUF3137 domain-containing protein [Hyphomonas sp.]MBA4337984.1 hypothetical protein [Hyphomonas sp.]
MTKGWDEIESHAGFAGAQARSEAELRPLLDKVKVDSIDPARQTKIISRAMTMAFFAFGGTFFALELFLPNGAVWEFMRFLLFPVLFIAYMAIALFLMRGQLAKLVVEAQARVGIKGEVMNRITAPLGVRYVPAPGGAPKGLEWLAKQSWAPAILRDAAASLNAAGGMDGAVAIVRDSGLLLEGYSYISGTPEQKAKFNEQASSMRHVEDGFEGTRGGLAFSMFEWIESVEDAPNIYHLVIVLAAPLRLHGVTQLRARKYVWPQDPNGTPLEDVDLGPKAFDALYRLRASDQVEARALFNPAVIERIIALAHGGKFRAVARQQHLVFDFANEANRFHLIDLITGEWSDETIRQTHADLAEALALVDALGHAFMLARKSGTSAP